MKKKPKLSLDKHPIVGTFVILILFLILIGIITFICTKIFHSISNDGWIDYAGNIISASIGALITTIVLVLQFKKSDDDKIKSELEKCFPYPIVYDFDRKTGNNMKILDLMNSGNGAIYNLRISDKQGEILIFRLTNRMESAMNDKYTKIASFIPADYCASLEFEKPIVDGEKIVFTFMDILGNFYSQNIYFKNLQIISEYPKITCSPS